MSNKRDAYGKQEEKLIQANQDLINNVNNKQKSKILIFCINKLERKSRV